MVDARSLGLRTSALIAKGEAIRPLPAGQQYETGPTLMEPRPYGEWRSQSLALLRSVLPPTHTYVTEFEASVQAPELPQVAAGVGILHGFSQDLDAGYLTDVRKLISAEVFVDFLAMAEHLLDEGYVPPAASLAGAVLEDSLRRTLNDRGVTATGNLESMNQVCVDRSIYSPLVFTQAKVWITLRNDADHGRFDRVEAERVRSMIRDLPGYLARDLGMA